MTSRPPAGRDAGARVVGFALAGGESRRMRQDKALLPWGDRDLLNHSLARLAAVSSDVRILSGPRARFLDRGVPVVIDPAADAGSPESAGRRGPLAGLFAALEAAAGRPALVLAVDLPLVPVRLLSRLVDRLPGFDAVVPASNGGPEPLAALYGTGCLDPIRRRLAAGELEARAFWPDVVVCSLPPAEYADLGDPDTLFLNVNVSDDYERARMIAPGSSPSSRRSGRGGRGL